MLGDSVVFRDGQWEAVYEVAVRHGRVLVVQRTGWGKSLVYFLATRLLRDAGAGPTLLISPLRALMRNQIEMAVRLRLRSATINSDNTKEWDQVEQALARNQCDVLLIAPERLSNERFLRNVLTRIRGRVGLFVVDEAHCISDWGHDFRPDYRRIVRILQALPPKVPVLCTTATANQRVVDDVVAQIGPDLKVLRGPLARSSLRLHNIVLADQSQHLAWLAQNLPSLPGSGIVYTLTVNDARRVAQWLRANGIQALPYYADLSNEERLLAEEALLKNQIKALVATVALGMGYDKPDLGFVVHFQRPGSVVAYYQQVGRAGRAVDDAYGILLSGSEDDEIQDYFIRTAFPSKAVVEGILIALEGTSGMTISELLNVVNLRKQTVEKALKLLEVEGAVARDQTRYFRTPNPWSPDTLRAEAVTRLRRQELEEIKRYVSHQGCLMELLARALDDPHAATCGRCMNCSGERLPTEVASDLVGNAVSFLRSDLLVIEPRKIWPASAVPELRGRIPESLRPRPGRALSVYGDAGWGREVARCKYAAGSFSDQLVEASAELIVSRWKPQPPPECVTAVPSLRNPIPVYNFAERLASRLGIPFEPMLTKVKETPPQKTMENSAQQLRNVFDAFQLIGKLPKGPILLVDDIVDSKWTLTVVSWLLLSNGGGPVHPFALASSAVGNN